MDLIVVLHDVSSAQRLIDMARLVYGMGFKYFIASKVYGAAASSGVPEASRLALRLGRFFSVLPSVREAVEIFEPSMTLIVSYEHGEPLSLEEVGELIERERKVLLVLGGIEPGPGKDVVGLGKPIYIRGVESRIGAVAEAALILYEASRRLSASTR
ncbi:MAG: recombinase RecB [Hyperthermus sp.]|nr:MAG: recombinase RecB [Hyperthermus sp.]